MHFFILQFLSGFALFIAFIQLIMGVQLLFFTRQAVIGHRYTTLIALLGFFITGICVSIIIAFLPNLYLDFILPYETFFKLAMIVFCFLYSFICLTNRFTKSTNNSIALFFIGVLLAIICFVLCSSFLVIFAISLGRVGVISYIFESFAFTIAGVFIILSLVYYYLIMILNFKPIEKQLYKIYSYLDPIFSVGFAAVGFGLLP